jgi:hypothetical protein
VHSLDKGIVGLEERFHAIFVVDLRDRRVFEQPITKRHFLLTLCRWHHDIVTDNEIDIASQGRECCR